MLTIELLNEKSSKSQQVTQAVADIEAIVQLQDAWTYQTLISLLKQDSVKMLVAYDKQQEIDPKVIGYCLYQVVFEQAEILRIGTHPDYQRQGIASQLFATLNNELINNKVESLLLEVRADNAPALALYERQGFVVIHKRKSYYQLPHRPAIDALILQRVYD